LEGGGKKAVSAAAVSFPTTTSTAAVATNNSTLHKHKQQYAYKTKNKTYFYTGSCIHSTSKPSSLTQKEHRDDAFYYKSGGAGCILNTQTIIALVEIGILILSRSYHIQ